MDLPRVAIDDLPLPVVTFLNAIGVPRPYLNEDTVSEFAAWSCSLAADVEQYIVGTVATAAAKPLFDKVQEVLSRLDWSQSGASGARPTSVVLGPASVRVETAALRSHAAALQAHAAAFQQGVRGLNF